MLDLGPHAGPGPLNLLGDELRIDESVGHSPRTAPHRAVPGRPLAVGPSARALVASVTVGRPFLVVQQLAGLRQFVEAGTRTHNATHQVGARMRADVSLDAEISLVAPLGLLHLRVALPLVAKC